MEGLGHKILKEYCLTFLILKDLFIYMQQVEDVIPFYEKIGFVKEGQQFEEVVIIPEFNTTK